MSNPGVITLTDKEISATKVFRVEDNLGESIHFHYNDIRIDLTIPELVYIAGVCDETIYELVKAENFNLEDFDGDFLNAYSQCLMDLTCVKEDKVKADSLYIQTHNLIKLPVRRRLDAGRAHKLKEVAENKIKSRANYDILLKHVETEHKVVLFNDEQVIMYGEQQAAQAYIHAPDTEIEVLRMYFDKGKHSVPAHPWIPFLFSWDKKRLLRVAKRMAKKVFG